MAALTAVKQGSAALPQEGVAPGHSGATGASPQWRELHEDMLRFIARTPAIEISSHALSFQSAEAKQEFHQRMNGLMYALAATSLAESDVLDTPVRAAFDTVERELVGKTGISGVRLPGTLADYRRDPLAAVPRVLFDICLRLLQGRFNPEDLEPYARERTTQHLRACECLLYEAWIAYGLINALEPVEIRGVGVLGGDHFIAQPLSALHCGHQVPLKDWRLPEALVRTAEGRCFAYKFEHLTELLSYRLPCRARDFTRAGNTAEQLCRRIFMLFDAPDFEVAPVIAQRSRKHVARPLLLAEHLDAEEYRQLEKRQEVRSRAEVMDTERPLQLVLRTGPGEVEMSSAETSAWDFDTRVVGLDAHKLAQLVCAV